MIEQGGAGAGRGGLLAGETEIGGGPDNRYVGYKIREEMEGFPPPVYFRLVRVQTIPNYP